MSKRKDTNEYKLDKYEQEMEDNYIRNYPNADKLDKYEQEIEDNLFTGPPMPPEEEKKLKEEIMAAARTHVKNRKNSRLITLQIYKDELKAVKSKASKQGLSYDVYISMLIRKDITEQLNAKI